MMFDTVEFYLLQEDHPHINFLKETSKHISVTSRGEGKFGRYVVGNHGGYKVIINNNRISFKKNSLARFRFGNNLKTLSRGDTKEVIQQIEEELHCPVGKAHLTRLDLAQHFPMKHDSSLYFPLLGESQYYIRLEQPNGVTYQNSKKVKTFYNKSIENQEKKRPFPEIYQNSNLLRYEFRFMKRLPEQFNLPKVTLAMLYDEKFYFELVRTWRKEYLEIKKVSVNTTSLIPTGSTKYLVEQLAARTILNMGQNQLFKTINEWHELNEISKKQTFDLRKAIKNICQAPDRYSGNELISELDKKVKDASRFC